MKTEDNWVERWNENMEELKPKGPFEKAGEEMEAKQEQNNVVELKRGPDDPMSDVVFRVGMNEEKTGIQVEYVGPVQQTVVELAEAAICGLANLIVDEQGDPSITVAKFIHFIKNTRPDVYKRYFGQKSGIILPNGNMV